VEHIVRENTITLGRMKGNSIALSDSSVSLSHAKITRVGDDFFLKDLNSTNGTMLNGQSISEARLRDGDQLKFGEVIAYFRLEPLSAPAPAAAPAGADPTAPPPPKPTAQSVPTPAPIPSVPVNPAPASPPPARAAPPVAPLPPLPAARKKPLRPVLFIFLGGVAVLAVTGFLMWNFFAGRPAPTKPAAQVAAPKVAPAASNPVAKTAPAIAAPTATPVHDQNLDNLLKALKSPDVAARRHAAGAIYNLGPAAKEALPFLPEALADADAEVRMWGALALVHNGVYEKAAIPILIQTLHHENPTLRQVACLSLAMIPYSDADKAAVVAPLMDVATKDTNTDVANDAVTALKIIAPDLVVGK
jgi:hypothetical protein